MSGQGADEWAAFSDAVVVGAGISGLYALHRLRELGLSVRAIEAGDDVGGTWYWNRYPGARCDIESMIYSYSWSGELEQDWTWSERYAAQPEILRYLEHVADRFDLRRDIQLGTRVTAAAFDEDEHRWSISTDAGEVLTAAFLVLATGCLSVPRLPDIEGVERFAGEAYHTGLWPHEPVDFAGKRVAVIGTGSSAVQVVPAVADEAAEVTVFQRTPAFSVPAWNGPLDAETVRERKERYSEYRRLARETGGGNPWHTRKQSVHDETPEQRKREFEARYALGGFNLHAAYHDLFTDAEANEMLSDFVRDKIRGRVRDPGLAELLCPYDYPLATKRMCVDTGYYEAFDRDNVHLVSVRETPIEEITEAGLRVGGEELAFDVIVFATGFDAMTGALLRIDLARPRRQLVAGEVGGGPTYLSRSDAGRLPEPVRDHGPRQPVGAQQHDGLDRAARRFRGRLHCVHGGQGLHVRRADRRGRTGVGRSRAGARRGVALPACQVSPLLVHGRERPRQAAGPAALRRRRGPVSATLRRDRGRGLSRLRLSAKIPSGRGR